MNFSYPPSHARAEVRTSFREWTFFRVLSYPKSPSPLPLSACGPLQLTADLCRVLVLWMAPSTSSGWVLRSSSSTQPSWASGGGKQAQLTAPAIPRRGFSGSVSKQVSWISPDVGAEALSSSRGSPGPGLRWARRRAGRAGQSLSTAPGSSLVSVCQRSILLSLFFRQSNQCFRRSPLALMPRTTPPAEGSPGQPGYLIYDSQGPSGTVPPTPSQALCGKARLSILPACLEGGHCSDHHMLRPSYCPPPPQSGPKDPILPCLSPGPEQYSGAAPPCTATQPTRNLGPQGLRVQPKRADHHPPFPLLYRALLCDPCQAPFPLWACSFSVTQGQAATWLWPDSGLCPRTGMLLNSIPIMASHQ